MNLYFIIIALAQYSNPPVPPWRNDRYIPKYIIKPPRTLQNETIKK